ncbi:hypothetical protein [Streptomyces gobitricini]|uniref:Uncharacterized protein n=1 Tax=Streptomyces gobitricini TaxID=68211 RepID=A0ABP5YQS7_9ACTN
MRKILATVATIGLAGLGVIVAATTAQASTGCDNAWAGATPGYFYAWDGTNCGGGLLGATDSYDTSYSDILGVFQGDDTNKASSIMNRGTSGMAVQVFNGTGSDWAGGHTCLRRAEYYMSSLSGHTFTSGVSVNNNISSHRWVWDGSCDKFLDS